MLEADIRRPSQQALEDSALRFLERRRSSEHSIGSIQPDLYHRRGSVVQHQSSAPGRSSIGRIQLQLSYNFATSDFLVSLIEVVDLVKLEAYYFQLVLGEDDNKDKMSRESSKQLGGEAVKRQDFKFALSFDDLAGKTLTIRLIDAHGRAGTNVMGEVCIDVSSFDPSADLFVWAEIDPSNAKDKLGELLVGVQYLSKVERLTITVHQARDLLKTHSTDNPDAYVKVTLIQDGKMVKKRKSGVRRNSLSPTWNEAMIFNTDEKSLRRTRIEISVMDYDRIGNDEVVGQISIGYDVPNSRFYWKDVVEGKSMLPVWIPLGAPGGSPA